MRLPLPGIAGRVFLFTAAIVCAASTPDAWVWVGELAALGTAKIPDSLAGVLVIGEVVRVRAALTGLVAPVGAVAADDVGAEEVRKYGRH